MSESAGLSGIGQVAVTVQNLGRAVEFYRTVLGLRFLYEVPNMAFFDCGGVRLLLALPESPGFDQPSSIIYYRVVDIAAAFGALSERGVQFVAGPHLVAKMSDHDLWMAFFHDTEGNTLALMSEIPQN